MARSDFIKFRVAPGEDTCWRAAARAAGMNLSSWLRDLADVAATTGTDPLAVRAELISLRRDLNAAVGDKLNLIAHAINADIKAGHPASRSTMALQEVADDLARIRAAIEALMGSRARTGPRLHRRPAPPTQAAIRELSTSCQQARNKPPLCPVCDAPLSGDGSCCCEFASQSEKPAVTPEDDEIIPGMGMTGAELDAMLGCRKSA